MQFWKMNAAITSVKAVIHSGIALTVIFGSSCLLFIDLKLVEKEAYASLFILTLEIKLSSISKISYLYFSICKHRFSLRINLNVL